MKLKYAFSICCLSLLFVSVISAEYYQYLDEDGIKHYTDDISDIPKDQRPNLNVYQNVQSPKKESEKTKTIITPESLKIQKNDLDSEYDSLVTKKKGLDSEYDSLLKKEQDLNKRKKALGQEKYNKEVTRINDEIKRYKAKSKAYETLAEQYKAKTKAYETLVEQYNKQIQPKEKK
ncbi:MAG: DUF4124 domain-containing protein [Desulfobacteraceae bacterium]|nr:DUF4124 domain-containing protein [Desulfobacteraceae bacterium]